MKQTRFYFLSHKRLYAILASLLTLGLSAAVQAQAQEKLRVADSLPVGHFFAETGTKFWMSEVARISGMPIQFEYYPAEQLGKAKDLLALTQSGVVDVGYVVPSYASDKMPLSAAAELPGGFSTSCQASLAYWKLSRNDGILAKQEYAPNGVRLMFVIVLPPYQIFSGKKIIDTYKNLEGMKLRTAGGAMDATVRSFSAVPVRMSAPEVYESLSRGTIDGMLFPFGSLLSYDLAGISKYGTSDENFGSAVLAYMMSEARFKKLPVKIQQAMDEAGEATTRRACAIADKDVATDIEKIRQKGVTFVTLSVGDKKVLAESMQVVAAKWAQGLDQRGKPGTAVLKAFQSALKEK